MEKKTLTIEFKQWSDGQLSFRCSNANCLSKLSFNPFGDYVHQTFETKDEVIAEVQKQFGDSQPTVNGDIVSWEKDFNG